MLRAQAIPATRTAAPLPLASVTDGPPRPARLPGVSSALFIALLALDLLLIAGHLVFFAFDLDDGRLLLSYEPGYGEVFQYAKFFGLAAVLAACAVCSGQARWLAWALVFSYLGLDDAF